MSKEICCKIPILAFYFGGMYEHLLPTHKILTIPKNLRLQLVKKILGQHFLKKNIADCY